MPVITGSSGSASEAYYQSLIAGKYGAAAGEAYASYAAAHPTLTPEQSGNDFLELILIEGLDAAVQTGVNAGVAVDTGTVAGAAAGAENAVATLSPTQWINKLGNVLSSRGTWVRLAEGVLGIALVLVAVAELGKGTGVGNMVKKVPFI
jgi:hypothetical protein